MRKGKGKGKENFYFAMLRFGMTKLENGFRLEELITYLQLAGYFIPSENSSLMHHFFRLTFYAKHAML